MGFKHLIPGTYAPVLTFFKPETEELDIDTFRQHVAYLASAGIGPVVCGSMSEAIMLNEAERLELIVAARQILDENDYALPLIVGTGLASTKETIALTEKAARAGADIVIVIPSGYYPPLMTRAALKDFYIAVQQASPVPVMLYNFPGAAGGVDMDSDLLLEIAKEGRNVCGAKLTCSGIGKFTRLAGYTCGEEYKTRYPRSFPLRKGQVPFVVFSGFSDFLLSGRAAKAHGAIAGIGNFAPRSLRKLYLLSEKAACSREPKDITAAEELQLLMAQADFATTKLHIPGAKRMLQELRGYGGLPRQPLQPVDDALYGAVMNDPAVKTIIAMEQNLEFQEAKPSEESWEETDKKPVQETISPLDQSVVVTRETPTGDDLEHYLATSQRAFTSWKSEALAQRIAVAQRFLQEMARAKDELSRDLSRQMGRPLPGCALEVDGTIKRGEHMVHIARECLGASYNQDTDTTDHKRFIERCPVGPVLVISPWNYPYFCQPSPQTPLCGEWFTELYRRAGLPEGVLQTIHCDPTQAEWLIKDARVQFVMFTGSVANGHAIVKAASDSFKGVGVELGGKDPAYVRHDADLEKTIPALADGIFFNSGQSCCSVERVYVHSSIYEDVVQGLAEIARNYKLGDPFDAPTTMGPVVSRRSAEFIRKQVAEAIAAGGRALVPQELFPQATADSNFVVPQVIADATHEMSLMMDETFGPVAGVMKVESDDEAIRLMNDSPYGLTASVWTDATRSMVEFEKISQQLEAGTIYLNNADNLDPALAWSGWKDSGRGISLSKFGFDAYTRTKSINIKVF